VALWREALLARAVLRGQTKGYQRHPQVQRFREHATPVQMIEAYLCEVLREAQRRGYAFDSSKVQQVGSVEAMKVNRGQVAFEVKHLLAKLQRRDLERWRELRTVKRWAVHPLMKPRSGAVEEWERQ